MKTMSARRSTITLVVFVTQLLTALLVLGVDGYAAAGDGIDIHYDKARTDRWRCRRCPFEQPTPAGMIEVGAHHTTDRDARFGRDTGLADDGTSALAAIHWRQPVEGGELTVSSRDLGLSSRRADVVWRTDGSRWRLTWREIPRAHFFGGRTPFSRGVDQRLPADWVRAFTTAEMTGFAQSSRLVDSETERRLVEIAGEQRLSANWSWFGRWSVETKDGERQRGADTIYQTVQLLEPVDHETSSFSTGLRFSAAQVRAAGWVDRSSFDSAVTGVRFENPFISFFESGSVGSETSSTSERVGLSLRIAPLPSTRVSARVAWAEESQDATFGRGILDSEPFPLGMDVERFDARFHLTSRVGNRLRWSTSWRIRDREVDDAGDFAFSPHALRVFALEDREATFRVRYRLSNGLRLDGGVRRNDAERPGQEQAAFDETGAWARLDWSWGRWQLTVDAARDERDAATFERITNNHPDTRRFHLADRDKDRIGVRLSFADGPFGFNVYRHDVEHRFDESLLGLTDQESASTGLGVDWAFDRTHRVSAFWSIDKLESLTFGTSDFVNRDWHSVTDDEVATWGFDWRAEGLGGAPIDLHLNWSHSDGIADYTTTWLGSVSPLPRLIADQQSAEFEVVYRTPTWQPFLRVFHERFDSRDWALDGVAHDALPTLLGLGLTSPNYRNTTYAVGVRRRW